MMKLIKLVLPIFLCTIWCIFLSKPISTTNVTLPPLGKFFSPFTGFWQNSLESKNSLSKSIKESKVKGKIYYDDRAVPHIQAKSQVDAYFMQGYTHAMHRLWQMDFSSRAAEGRISEIIGSKALEFDKTKRRKGIAEAAKNSIEIWKKVPEVYSLLDAYSNGINFFIDHLEYKDYPIEYKLMNFAPEHWSPYKSSLFHKSMAEILCGRDQDVELSNAKLIFGEDFNLLFPEIDPLTDPVIPSGTKWGFKLDSMHQVISDEKNNEIIPIVLDSSASGLGSNNWAIGKWKSTSGNPILCNDPHLSLNLPSIWYEQQIITPESNVYGVSFAGIPGVVIGFNENIAWGITNAGWDVQDWYKVNWTNNTQTEYLIDGVKEKVKYRIEKILIMGGEAVYDTIKITRWGPIVYENTSASKFGLAMHWIIQDTFQVNELSTFVGLNKAKNYTDYRSAIKNFSYPAQNMAYADKLGNIAMTVQGGMPIKSQQQGRFILDGSKSENAWHGFIPTDKVPSTINPSRGFVASANQRSTHTDYPNYYNNGDFRDARGTLINRFLREQKTWSIDDLKKLQFNNYSLLAETALPNMLQAIDTATLDPSKMIRYHALQKWNYNYDSSSSEAIIFDLWIQNLTNIIWDEVTMDTLVKYTSIPSDQTTVRLMREYPNLKYYDIKSTKTIETLKNLIHISFDSTHNQLTVLSAKTWASFKGTHIDHMAKIPAFSIPYVSTSGSKDIINACWKTWGPSWRMLVELTADGPNAYGIYPGGQDGRPGNKHYMDMVEPWSKGEYFTLKYCNNEDALNQISKTIYQFEK